MKNPQRASLILPFSSDIILQTKPAIRCPPNTNNPKIIVRTMWVVEPCVTPHIQLVILAKNNSPNPLKGNSYDSVAFHSPFCTLIFVLLRARIFNASSTGLRTLDLKSAKRLTLPIKEAPIAI